MLENMTNLPCWSEVSSFQSDASKVSERKLRFGPKKSKPIFNCHHLSFERRRVQWQSLNSQSCLRIEVKVASYLPTHPPGSLDLVHFNTVPRNWHSFDLSKHFANPCQNSYSLMSLTSSYLSRSLNVMQTCVSSAL